ncbi:MAG: hypothetical protein WAN59_10720 [Candidatus Baltobacteraceae bacterium]
MPHRKATAAAIKADRFYPSIREALDDLQPAIADRISHDVQLNQIIELLERRLNVPARTLEMYLRGATISRRHSPKVVNTSKLARR